MMQYIQIKKKIVLSSHEEQINYLKKYTFSKDSVNPVVNIEKLSDAEIEHLYLANIRCKNFGSITEIKGKDMPECDLLVYSFPCQDLSTGGKTLGMSKGSGTRSGLLWEIERILQELKEINKLPKYLLMENVKAIFANSNKADLDQWLKVLNEMGYHNGSKMVLNSLDFGIPQDRKRAFIISCLGEDVNDKSLLSYKNNDYNFLDFMRLDYDSKKELRDEADNAQLNATVSREDMWRINQRYPITKETTINTITCNMDRSNTAAMFKYDGTYKGNTYRLLTIREAFLLMGFLESEYEKTLALGLSYRKMNKLIGNSIVVNVLSEIFKCLFSDKYSKE